MNPMIAQPAPRTIMMTHFSLTTHALLLALSAASAVTCAAAERVPYDLSKETYKTETLFSYDGCMDHRLMGNSGEPKVYKNHVYLATIAYGRHPRILQVPLDGGKAKIGHLEPDFQISEDSHRYFIVGIDKNGYIHVTGGMHGGPWRYWISAKPEDVSKFVPTVPGRLSKEFESTPEDVAEIVPAVRGQQQSPPGYGITYPHFFADTAGNLYIQARGSVPSFQKGRERKIVQIGLLSVYDAEKRTWRLWGADIPKGYGGRPGYPVTVWEDNFHNGEAGVGWYGRNTADFVAARDNTLHFLFNVLNYSPPSGRLNDSDEGGGGKNILYATSKDGGRTLQRTNGSKVEWPVRAEAGPYQPDVIYDAAADYAAAERNGGAFPGLVGATIQLDWKNRPMIRAHKKISNEAVVFRLEDRKWVSCPAKAFGKWRDNAGVLMKPVEKSGEVVRLWDEEHSRVVKLGQEIEKLDEDYLRDTGTMIYTTKNPKAGNKVINIMRTTIQRPATGAGSGLTQESTTVNDKGTKR